MEVSKEVAAPPDLVFRRLCDLEWCSRVTEAIARCERIKEARDGTRFGPGLTWRETRVIFGKDATEEMEVRAVDNSRRAFTVGSISCNMDYTSVIRVEDTGSGSEIFMSMHSEPIGCVARVMSWIMTPMMSGMMKNMLLKDLSDMKLAIERETDSGECTEGKKDS